MQTDSISVWLGQVARPLSAGVLVRRIDHDRHGTRAEVVQKWGEINSPDEGTISFVSRQPQDRFVTVALRSELDFSTVCRNLGD
jgi:hypothetical protein